MPLLPKVCAQPSAATVKALRFPSMNANPAALSSADGHMMPTRDVKIAPPWPEPYPNSHQPGFFPKAAEMCPAIPLSVRRTRFPKNASVLDTPAPVSLTCPLGDTVQG